MSRFCRLLLATILFVGVAYPQDRRIWILVPNFENSGVRRLDEFGTRTSTFIFLQLWGRLIQHPTPNPEGLDFGNAGVTWDSEALPPRSYEDAEALARLQKEDPVLIVWGQLDEWGDSIFIHPRLAIRTDGSASSLTSAIWKIKVGKGVTTKAISVGLPGLRYDFSPVQLSKDVISQFGAPGGLTLLRDPHPDADKIGEVGDYFTRILQEGDYAKVQVRGLPSPGWVYVPPLSSAPTEFVEFTSGVLKVLRQDWKGALANFNRTASVKNTPESVRADNLLLAALCLSASGKHQAAVTLLKGARERPAQSLRLSQYLAMAYLSGIVDDPEHSGGYTEELRALIRANLVGPTSFAAWWKDLESSLDQPSESRPERREETVRPQ